MIHNDYTHYTDDDCLKRTRMCLLQVCSTQYMYKLVSHNDNTCTAVKVNCLILLCSTSYLFYSRVKNSNKNTTSAYYQQQRQQTHEFFTWWKGRYGVIQNKLRQDYLYILKHAYIVFVSLVLSFVLYVTFLSLLSCIITIVQFFRAEKYI